MSNTEVLDFPSPENSDKQFVLVIVVTFINCHSVAGSACILKDEYDDRWLENILKFDHGFSYVQDGKHNCPLDLLVENP